VPLQLIGFVLLVIDFAISEYPTNPDRGMKAELIALE
jgi:hypothetical protein